MYTSGDFFREDLIIQDEYYIKMAIELANKGLGKTDPTPLVGAVIVKNEILFHNSLLYGGTYMINQEKIRIAMEMIIEAIGEDIQREGLLDTPKRVAKMYTEVFSGIHEDPRVHMETFFNTEHDEMVLVKDIAFYSMCEHHFLPFFGKVSVAYIPKNGKITGLSKLARVVDCIAKRPQLQERLTSSIADVIMECLDSEGVAVVVDAEHMCMSMRGIKKPGARTVTSAVRGIFRSDARTRSEVFALIKE